MPLPHRTLAACAVLALPVAGCGDRGKDDPIEVVKRYVESYDKGDLAVCSDLVTDGYLRRLSRAAGGADGLLACEALVRGSEQLDISLDVVPRVEQTDGTYEVDARLNVDGEQVEQHLRLRRQGDALLVDQVDEFLGRRPQ
jgi:hypothetical protein